MGLKQSRKTICIVTGGDQADCEDLLRNEILAGVIQSEAQPQPAHIRQKAAKD
jgi:hypothetical protein